MSFAYSFYGHFTKLTTEENRKKFCSRHKYLNKSYIVQSTNFRINSKVNINIKTCDKEFRNRMSMLFILTS